MDPLNEIMEHFEEQAEAFCRQMEDAPIKAIMWRVGATEQYIEQVMQELGEMEEDERISYLVAANSGLIATCVSLIKSLAATLCLAMHEEEAKDVKPRENITGAVLGGV